MTHLGGLALLEESLLAGLLGGLVLGEVAGVAGLLQDGFVDTSNIHLGRGRNDVPGVHPSEGDAVDFEGTGDEEHTLLEVLQDDDTLAAEAASEEDDDGAGSERLANLGRADGLAGLEMVSVLRFHIAIPSCVRRLLSRLQRSQHSQAQQRSDSPACAGSRVSSSCMLFWRADRACCRLAWMERTFLGTAASSAG